MFIFLTVLASPVRSEVERGINLKSSEFWDKGVMPQSGTCIMAELKEQPLWAAEGNAGSLLKLKQSVWVKCPGVLGLAMNRFPFLRRCSWSGIPCREGGCGEENSLTCDWEITLDMHRGKGRHLSDYFFLKKMGQVQHLDFFQVWSTGCSNYEGMLLRVLFLSACSVEQLFFSHVCSLSGIFWTSERFFSSTGLLLWANFS